MLSKYAFSTQKSAKNFAKEFGGEVMSFEQALQVATKGLAKNTQMMQNKRMMMAKHGAKIYGKICKPTSEKFATVADAKTYIVQNRLCGDIKGKKLQAIAIYLTSKK